MTEEERAEYYDQMGDDAGVWGEIEEACHAPTEVGKRGGLSTTVTVRFAPEDAAKLRELSERLQRTYSDVVREAVRRLIEPTFAIDVTTVTYNVTQLDLLDRESRILVPSLGAKTKTVGTAGRNYSQVA